jgi:phosphoribosylanthranilate isomerase
MRPWVKFCGCTSWDDVTMAIEAGADAFGMIFAPSPRRIAWEAAVEIAHRVPPSIEPVAVFVDPSKEAVDAVRGLFPHARIQFSGNEPAGVVASHGGRALKAIHVDPDEDPAELDARCDRHPRAMILFDARHDGLAGGSGTPFAWDLVTPIAAARRVVMAGGLSAENVSACLSSVRPYGVDVRSGIETDGRKDWEKMRAFVRAVREADEA